MAEAYVLTSIMGGGWEEVISNVGKTEWMFNVIRAQFLTKKEVSKETKI